jgi:hypothetical protein
MRLHTFRFAPGAVAILALAVATASAEEKPKAPSKLLQVTVGQTVRLQMSTKRPITRVFNDRDDIVRVRPVPDDPTTVLVTGLAVGKARLILIDDNGREEQRELGKPARK